MIATSRTASQEKSQLKNETDELMQTKTVIGYIHYITIAEPA